MTADHQEARSDLDTINTKAREFYMATVTFASSCMMDRLFINKLIAMYPELFEKHAKKPKNPTDEISDWVFTDMMGEAFRVTFFGSTDKTERTYFIKSNSDSMLRPARKIKDILNKEGIHEHDDELDKIIERQTSIDKALRELEYALCDALKMSIGYYDEIILDGLPTEWDEDHQAICYPYEKDGSLCFELLYYPESDWREVFIYDVEKTYEIVRNALEKILNEEEVIK